MKKYPHQELIREAIKNADFRFVVEAIGTALDAEGLVIVPREPTEAMTTQGCLAIMDIVLVGPPLIGKSYRAMLAAAGGDDG